MRRGKSSRIVGFEELVVSLEYSLPINTVPRRLIPSYRGVKTEGFSFNAAALKTEDCLTQTPVAKLLEYGYSRTLT